MKNLFCKRLKRFLRKWCWCTVWSWRRSRGPGSAACCGGLEVRRCGNDQHGCDMADLEMHSFRRTKMIQLKTS